MDVLESDLPGVGKKYEIPVGGGSYFVIIVHNSGKREIYRRESEDTDSEKVFELTDREARTIGTVLEGAHFQPVRTDQVETMLGEGTLLEWFSVDPDSPLVGQTLEEAEIGRQTGVTVVVIQRDSEVIAGPGADTEIAVGDTLVVVGDRESCHEFEKLLEGKA